MELRDLDGAGLAQLGGTGIVENSGIRSARHTRSIGRQPLPELDNARIEWHRRALLGVDQQGLIGMEPPSHFG